MKKTRKDQKHSSTVLSQEGRSRVLSSTTMNYDHSIGPSRSSRARRAQRARAALGAFSAAGFIVLMATSGTTESSNNLSNLRRQLAEAVSTTAASAKEDIKVKYFVKTSGQRPYLSFANNIADCWGKDITEGDPNNKHRITFLEDTHNNPEGVDELEKEYPWITIERVRGTDCQGDYKVVGGDVNCAHWAQRLKTRAVFDLFGKEAFHNAVDGVLGEGEDGADNTDASYYDWLCYFDDDMVVNVDVLEEELQSKQEECAPNCFLADAPAFGGKTKYPAGGWCMERMAAMRVHKLLATHSDEELAWKGNDDLAFSMMLTEKLGIAVTNSDLWFSELSRPIIKDGKLAKSTQFESSYFDFDKYPRIEWSKNSKFLEMWLPSLSVYNVRKSRPANIAKADEMIESMRIAAAEGQTKVPSASYSTNAVAPTLIMSTPEEESSTGTVAMPEEETERKLEQEKEPSFTLVEPELSISVAGEATLEDQHAQRVLEDKKEETESTAPEVPYRSDVRNLEGEALPFTLVEPELPITIPE